jgi:TetR/AcrR family transcriptional regulator, cholesterol catabolism regulator
MTTSKATPPPIRDADPRPGRSAKKRTQDIIETAAQIFQSQGYAETSVHDIAEAVGILKGSLYYYIKSKEDLLFQVMSDVHEGALELIERVQAIDAPAIERLRAYIRGHVAYNTQNVTKMAVFYHDYRSLSEERLAEILERRRSYEAFLQDLIKEAQKEGSIDSSLEPKLAAFSLFGMMNWVYHWYRPDGPWTPELIGDQVAAMAIDGLAGPTRRGASAPRRVTAGTGGRRPKA